jgi:hypothetical protein
VRKYTPRDPRAVTTVEIAESVLSGRKTDADMARLYHVSRPTVSRIASEYRQQKEGSLT